MICLLLLKIRTEQSDNPETRNMTLMQEKQMSATLKITKNGKIKDYFNLTDKKNRTFGGMY